MTSDSITKLSIDQLYVGMTESIPKLLQAKMLENSLNFQVKSDTFR